MTFFLVFLFVFFNFFAPQIIHRIWTVNIDQQTAEYIFKEEPMYHIKKINRKSLYKMPRVTFSLFQSITRMTDHHLRDTLALVWKWSWMSCCLIVSHKNCKINANGQQLIHMYVCYLTKVNLLSATINVWHLKMEPLAKLVLFSACLGFF